MSFRTKTEDLFPQTALLTLKNSEMANYKEIHYFQISWRAPSRENFQSGVISIPTQQCSFSLGPLAPSLEFDAII